MHGNPNTNLLHSGPGGVFRRVDRELEQAVKSNFRSKSAGVVATDKEISHAKQALSILGADTIAAIELTNKISAMCPPASKKKSQGEEDGELFPHSFAAHQD